MTTARTLPTLPSWAAGTEITGAALAQMVTYQAFWANPPSFRIEQHSAQNIPTGTATQVTCETLIHDSDGGVAAGTPFSYTVPFSGVWDFDGAASVAVNATGWRAPAIYTNGAPFNGAQPIFAPPTATFQGLAVAKGVVCVAGDVIALYMQQSSGSTLATSTTAQQYSWLAGTMRSFGSP